MKNNMKDSFIPLSTSQQVKDFIEFSPIWKDMKFELRIWLSEIHMLMENLDGTVTHRELDRLGGSAEALRNLSDFPSVLLSSIETKTKEKIKEDNDEC